MLKIRIISGIISMIFLIIVFEAIRRRKFMEKYALLWIFSGSLVFILSIFPEPLFKIAQITGLYYLTVLLLFSFIFILLIVLYLSISISKLAENNKELAQEMGILRLKLERLKKGIKNE
jgi:hypothetical protein